MRWLWIAPLGVLIAELIFDGTRVWHVSTACVIWFLVLAVVGLLSVLRIVALALKAQDWADSWVLNNPNGLTVDVGVALLAASTAAPREPDLDLCPKPDELPSDRDRHCREPPPRHWLLRSIFPSQFWAEIMPLLAILATAR